jgi:iron complex outermembrane receptor protein
MHRKKFTSLYVFLVLMALRSGAFAQSAADTSSQNNDAIPDIVVTAQKRTETVNSTPVALTALTMNDLEVSATNSIRDFVSVIPDLQIHTAVSAGYFGLAIRGVATQSYANTGNPSISTYIDGVYVDLAVGFASGLYDLQRVEVLRGPQGTLYGRSATGGNVNVVTADPTHHFDAAADVSFGNYGDIQTHGMVNLPVSESLAVRAAFATHQSDGYYDTLGTTARRYGALDDLNGRVTALFTPIENFSWRLSWDHYDTKGTPGARLIASGDDGRPLDGLSPYEQPSYPDPQPENYLNSNAIRSRMEWQIAGPLSLSYVAGYQHIAADYTYVTAEAGGPAYSAFREYSSYRSAAQFHELDLNYSDTRFKNVLGASYFDEKIPFTGAYAIRAGFNSAFYRYPNDGTHKQSWGVFDQLTWSLTDRLNLTGGLRYNRDEQSQAAFLQNNCAASSYPGLLISQIASLTGCPQSVVPSGAGSFSNTSWKGGVDYTVRPGTMIYGSVTTSYKPGGVQAGLPASLPATFASEHVKGFEAGAKTFLLDDRVNLRLAGFYVDYTDLQAFQNLSFANRQVLVTLNAASAHTYGTELEGEWNISSNDHFKGFVTYLHATYNKFDGGIDIRSNTSIGSLAGSYLPFAPEFSIRGQYSHNFDLPHGATLTPTAIAYWQSISYTQSYNIPVFAVRAYSKTDASLMYVDGSHHWNVSAYVDNLEDKAVRTGDFASQNVVYTEYGAPRTFGFKVAYHY